MSSYFDKALTKAKKQGLSAAQVAGLRYTEIAALAGVKIGANGESPKDFFYEAIRAKIVARLNDEFRLAALEADRAVYENAIKALPGKAGKVVVVDPDGTFKIISSIDIQDISTIVQDDKEEIGLLKSIWRKLVK